MESLFLDTNVIIRHLTQDDLEMAARARALLQQAEQGALTLIGSESIVVAAVPACELAPGLTPPAIGPLQAG